LEGIYVNLTLDIETNSKHDHIWMCYTHNSDTGEYVCHTSVQTLTPLLDIADRVIGHNIMGFDAPVLNKVWKTKIGWNKLKDTLIMSRLLNPALEDGHSLAAWGKRLGNKKVEYSRIWHWLTGNEYDKNSTRPYDEPMDNLNKFYCKQDVALTVDLFAKLEAELADWGESVELEHEVAFILTKQEKHGFKFNKKKAQCLLATLSGELADIEGTLQDTFPPISEERVSEKTGKALKTKVTAFNPASRQQIAERLQGLGVKFKQKTEKGSIVVDESVLSKIELPEAKLICRYLMLQKRITQITSWVEAAGDTDRVHGRVMSIGAITGRMSHMSPNMAQIPNSSSEYGPECRDLWTVDEGNKLVGIDASGLELRMLAHYMQDLAYIKTVVEGNSKDGTDVHTMNQKAAGLATRDLAKTFIYAFLYGAGYEKIGSIIGGGKKAGGQLSRKFLNNTPALLKLKNRVSRFAELGFMRGMDGRKIWVRSEHAALNTLLQGTGAILMKRALIILHKKLKCGIIQAHYVANVHDEWQIEVEEEDADRVGRMGVEAIKEAGLYYNLRCPTSGEYKIGNTWKETH
jgi:DNA polymerase I